MMRTRFLLLFVLLASLFSLSMAQDEGMYYVYFSDGRVWGYPKNCVKEVLNDNKGYSLILQNDSLIAWPAEEVQSVSEAAPDYPQFTAFKLDDKLNDQIYRDVTATVTTSEVTATVSGIGKYLTPSFAMDQAGAVAYVNGVEQVSGESRLRFADEVTYTLGHPDYQCLSMVKISDEIWSNPEGEVTEIALTADMLSTNAPTSMENEGLEMMLDNNPNTIFHSTWSRDPIYSVDLTKQVYLSVTLEHSITDLQFYYKGRTDAGNYNVFKWTIEVSADGEEWAEVAALDESAGVPISGSGVEYTSPTVSLGGEYRYLRFVASEVEYKNYLCLSEFRLYEVGDIGEPELLQPAQYAYRMVPMGREVPVRIDWLTDHATSVPRIDIDIDGGEMVSSKDYYLNAHISFQGNGVWDDYNFQDSVKIKGRGNSSWSSNPYAKNPYRLKFASSVKPFGMKKGKNWNLIAQKQSGSLMTNPVAHKIARMVGLETANDVIPVELYMNGEYRGSYFFTQKVGMANNNVDYEDESMAALFELDEYYEAGKFSSESYGLPVNIKAPEFGEDETLLDYYGVQEEFNRFETAVYNNSNYERFVDMDMLVRYMLVNDLVLNSELNHPKSAFLSRENMGHMSRRYVFGPAWDFDWAYGYEGTGSYCVSEEAIDLFSFFSYQSGSQFFSDVLRSSDWVQYHYSKLWMEFMEKHLQEVIDFVDDYYAYARSSFVHNSEKWGDGSNYDTNVANMKSWLAGRAQYIMGSLVPYDADTPEPFAYGDLNGDGGIDHTDMAYMLAALFDASPEDWQPVQADADADGVVALNDLTWLNLLLEDRQSALSPDRFRGMVLWSRDEDEEEEAYAYDFDIDDMQTLVPSLHMEASSMRTASVSDELRLMVNEASGSWSADVMLTNATPYIAFSMDFVLSDAFCILDVSSAVTLSPRTEGIFVTEIRLISENTYRLIGYSDNNAAIRDNEGVLLTLSLNSSADLAPDTYYIGVENIQFVTENALKESWGEVAVEFNVTENQTSQSISQQNNFDENHSVNIYDIHGRLVRKNATTLEGLGKGVYIIKQKKVVLP